MIAIVDDDEDVRGAVHDLLKSAGLTAQSFASAEAFLDFGQRDTVACMIVDVRMPGMSGLELQAKLAEQGCKIPIIFITAYGDTKTRNRAIKAGAVDLLEKPFDGDVLLARVCAVL